MTSKSAQRPKPRPQKKAEDAPIPFDEALRRMVNAPPQHKTAKKAVTKRK
jgi:hypothetical protein